MSNSTKEPKLSPTNRRLPGRRRDSNRVRFKTRLRPIRARAPRVLLPAAPNPTLAVRHNPTPVKHLPAPEEFCLVNFKKTKNNGHLTISRLFGNQETLATLSAGRSSVTAPNGRRKTRWSQRLLFQRAFEKLAALGAHFLVCHVRGPTVSKRYLYKHLSRRFKFVILKDVTGLPHNGCRQPSLRRK